MWLERCQTKFTWKWLERCHPFDAPCSHRRKHLLSSGPSVCVCGTNPRQRPAKAQKTHTSRVTWQEKIFGPREIAVMAPTQSDRDTLGSPRTPRNAKSGLGPAGANSTVADSDYQEQLYQRVRDGADPLDDLDTAMIFTYVDKDGFVPKSAMRPR